MKKAMIMASLCAVPLTFAATTANMYGFVKSSYIMTDKVNTSSSFKPFYANNSEDNTLSDFDNEAKSQFSTTNSRWGIKANNGSKTKGIFEFDLDAQQKSGASKADTLTIRVRQANLEYSTSKDAKITFGKKWTIFSGVNPFTYQATKISFWSGNNGFLVDGFDYSRKMRNTNIGVELSQDANRDENLVSAPTTTLLVGHTFGDHHIGAAHTMATLSYKTADDSDKDSAASGTKLFYKGKFGATSAIFQYTMGSNLGSIHTGGLATAQAGNDDEYKETGILASVKYSGNDWSVFGSYGVSELADEEEATAAKANGKSVATNALMSLGFDMALDPGLTVFVEHLAFTTGYYDGTETTDSTASLTELGLRYKF